MAVPALKRFLLSLGASALASGVHVVLLAWVAIGELGLGGAQFGWVQSAALLPSLLFVLYAGALADRYNPVSVLIFAQLLLTACYAFLASSLALDQANFYTLLIYASLVGVGTAFSQPVKEKLIAELGEQTFQQRFSLSSIVQFAFQSAGVALAAAVDQVGVIFIIAGQCLITLLSICSLLSIRSRFLPQKLDVTPSPLEDIRRGLHYAGGSGPLKQLLLLVAFNGYMHMGVFLVLLPYIATQLYQLGAAQYAGLQLAFVLGMITAHFGMLRRSVVSHPGQGALFSLLYTAFTGLALSKMPTVFGLYSLIFIWGLVAGNSAAHSRLVIQALVTRELRGRLMSIYQLMLFGAAPLGALVTGYIISYMSIADILSVMSYSSIGLFVLFLFSRALWSVSGENLEKTVE